MSVLTARRQPGSLPTVALRHVGALVIAVALLAIAASIQPITSQPGIWLLAGAAAGALAGMVDRGWLGLAFVVGGIVIGVGLELAFTHRGTDEAATAFAAAAGLYLATALAGAAAYLIARLIRRQLS